MTSKMVMQAYNASHVDASHGLDLPDSKMCVDDYVPSLTEYLTAINTTGLVLIVLGGFAVTITIGIFIDTMIYVFKSAHPSVKGNTGFVMSVYPVVTIASYSAVIVPRAQLVSEAVTQGMFMAALYQLFCLLVAYSGGELQLIEKLKAQPVTLRTGPCCCYPCCIIPDMKMTKKTLYFLRFLVLQLPVIQGFLYLIILVMWAEEQSLYSVNYMYLQPVVGASILLGVWGMLITMKMLGETLRDFHVQGKFIVLQLVLLLAKLQNLIARIVTWSGALPCLAPISPTIATNLIYNTVMMFEMVLLSIFARNLYKREDRLGDSPNGVIQMSKTLELPKVKVTEDL